MFVDGVHTVVIAEQLRCVKMLLFQHKIQEELLLDCTLKKKNHIPSSPTPIPYQFSNLPAVSVIYSVEVIWFYHLNLHNISNHIPGLRAEGHLMTNSCCPAVKTTPQDLSLKLLKATEQTKFYIRNRGFRGGTELFSFFMIGNHNLSL